MPDEKISREEKIRLRAYMHWLEDGQQDGREVEHWHAAVEDIDRESETSDSEAELGGVSQNNSAVGSPLPDKTRHA